MAGRDDLMIFSAVLTTLCSAFLSAPRQLPYQTETLLVRMLSIAPLKKMVRAEVGRSALLILLRKWSRVCAFLTSAVVLVVHERSFVMCTPRNLVLCTDSTALPLMVSGVCGVHSHFFSFIDIELKVVDVAPVDELLYLLSVC